MRSSTIKNNFTSGELTPLMYGRSELEPYQKGLAECINARVLRHGGATRRDGLEYLGSVKDQSKKTRLIPFIFSEADSVVVELSDLRMRFWIDGVLLETATNYVANGSFDAGIGSWTDASSGVASIAWNATAKTIELEGIIGTALARQTITGLTTGQRHKITFMLGDKSVSGSHRVRIGTAVGLSNLLDIDPDQGSVSYEFTPTAATVYLEFESTSSISTARSWYDDIEIRNISTTELVTVFTEAELFEVMFAQSNDFMWLTHRNHHPQNLIRTSPTVYTMQDAVVDQGPYGSILDQTVTMRLWDNVSIYTAGTGIDRRIIAGSASFSASDVGEHFYLVSTYDPTETVEVKTTGFIDSTNMYCEFLADVPTNLQNKNTFLWANELMNDRTADYPAAVTFHDQRLVYGGSLLYPQNLFGSTIGAFGTFSQGVEGDDSYNFMLASPRQNEINWLTLKHDLIIGTLSNEWAMRGGGLEDPITPSNVVTRAYTSEGSMRVMPEEANDITAFVQRAGHKLIGFAYDEGNKVITTTDLSLLAEHLTSSSIITQISFKSERESILWIVTDDGKLLGMTYDSSQNILAWHQHTSEANALFESIVTIPAGDSDETYVVVKRTVGSTVRRHIERLRDHDWRIDNDPYYVDSGTTYSGASTDVITNLGHLEGQTVEVYSDGESLGEYLVDDGYITLSKAVTEAHIGLGYVSRIKELPEGSNTQDGSAHTRQKRKPKVDVRLYKTQAIRVNGDVRDLPREPSATKPELFSGIIETSNLGWDYEAANVIESVGPNPLTVLAIRSTLNIGQE